MINNSIQWETRNPGLIIINLSNGCCYDTIDEVNRIIDFIIKQNFDGKRIKNRCFISIIEYDAEIKKLMSGFLQESEANPLCIEEVTKKVSDGAGGLVEIKYKMPIWIDDFSCDVIPNFTNMSEAFGMAKSFIEDWMTDNPDSPTPIIINLSEDISCHENRDMTDWMRETVDVVNTIKTIDKLDGKVSIYNALLTKALSEIKFPKSVLKFQSLMLCLEMIVPKWYSKNLILN